MMERHVTSDYAVRQLGAATVMQAVKDYFHPKATEKHQAAILKDLRSSWMQTLTDGTSANVAEQLEKNHKEIAERLRRHGEDVL